MSTSAVSKFRAINDFPELVEYLGDELDWPIQTDDFEEMTFDYSAEELGLDAKISPKFMEIRRLRPLDKDQPWGIFFIRFDDSKLPVVALRRLLSKLALKKRSTGNTGDRASWHENDLLLISQTGSQNDKSISFAHFASNPEKTDLPILKVLGWDDDDTGLKIDYVIETLREKLIWPDDPTDSKAWRTQWRNAFTLKNREVIQSSKEMAERLGQLALAVRTRLREVLAIESEEGPVHKLMSVFKENLISDLDTDSFSDMYAQTIAYGLLSARIINPKANTADAAHTQIPITNPFLRDLMETFLKVGGRSHSSGVGLDFDELGINEVVDLLDNTNMEAVLRDFGDRNQKEDPVMHFFEGFLQEYDSKIRKDRGVFYTPQPVVSFIVRSVDEQLRTEFGLEDGLADTTTWGELAARIKDLEIPEDTSPNQAFVQILDPATGTGTFPVEVIDLIYKTMTTKWQLQGLRETQVKELWNEYVPKHLLPRLHGYELMMAPYAIAHMKIGLKLYETGYRFNSDQRARIYLTNALEPAQDFSGTLAFAIPALAYEAKAVNAIKRDQRFTVVIGNPPYSARSYNLTPGNRALVEPYKYVAKERIKEKGALQLEKNLNDDYVKFIRFAQLVTCGNAAVISMITNHSFLENPTLRGMRWSLLSDFSHMDFIDLGGNIARKEKTETGETDENVFEISQGVSIFTLARCEFLQQAKRVRHLTLRGSRGFKNSRLMLSSSCSIGFDAIEPASPLFLFRHENIEMRNEYARYVSVTDLLPLNSTGVKTHRDKFCIDIEESELRNRISDLWDVRITDQELLERYGLVDTHGWQLSRCRKSLKSDKRRADHFGRILYRPFDWRSIYFSEDVVELARMAVSSNFLGSKNIGLVFMRQVAGDNAYTHFGVTRDPVDNRAFYSNRGTMSFAPLYRLESTDSSQLFAGLDMDRVLNLAPEVMRAFESLRIRPKISPEDVLGYVYAVFYSPGYRKRYKDFIRVDFPRFPVPEAPKIFQDLSNLGNELTALHLLESERFDALESLVFGAGEFQVEKVSYSDGTVWIDKAKTRGFHGVPEEVWNFHFGGYQVCEKWLKDREAKGGKNPAPGRVLTHEDIEHYQKIVVALSETIRIMAEIDEVIEAHGGWPGAFIASDT